MYRKKSIGIRDSFSNYSIYSSFSTYTLRIQNYKSYQNFCQNTQNIQLIDQVCILINSLLLLTKYCFCKIVNLNFFINLFSINTFYWNLSYFISEFRIMQQHCGGGSETKDDKYQLVQILKNDTMHEGQSSDYNILEATYSEDLTQNKTKKSLFAALIKRKRLGRAQAKITKKIETCSMFNFGSETASSDEFDNTYFSEQGLAKPEPDYQSKTKTCNIFKKIIKRSDSDIIKMSKRKKNCCGNGNKCEMKALQPVTLSKIVPTSYIPKHSVKLIAGLNELQDILHNLQHCEEHMVYLLKKYIEDKNIAKQILDASFEYFAHQYDSKSLTCVLANKMWSQELEVKKAQDYSLQKRINFLIKTNRNLESKLENLYRQCEKLAGRNNIYPKRFLHMRSFGKIYARQLIDNNRKLLKKVNALTGVISDFEEELQKLQHQKEMIEKDKQNFKSQVYHLENVLDKQNTDYRIESAAIMNELNHQNSIVNEASSVTQMIVQDIEDFLRQLMEFSIKFTCPRLKGKNHNVPELLQQIRAYLREIFLTLITAYKNVAAVAQEVTKLRQTNARLQENLQKSTSELDNLSKKIERNSEMDIPRVETICRKLEQQNSILKAKLDVAIEENNLLKEELKPQNLKTSRSTDTEVLEQDQSISKQIDELVARASQIEPKELPKELKSNDEKFEYLRSRYNQIVENKKQITDSLHSLENENQSLIQAQENYQNDIISLHDAIDILSSQNDLLKKQLSSEHQTVTTLQQERLKYLEEKNLLKTIFNCFKTEIQRIQQLEGAVADMTKETSRLSLVAEFNKQLGDQLKNEVEIKEGVIVELKQTLEKLSNIQVDNDKEKMNLCAQLSEVVTVKDKLTDCLEEELKKNVDLDESKKKMENYAKSQIKVYEEMQKSERAALKELLKDFKDMIRQRDCLVAIQAENTNKYKILEQKYSDLRKEYEVLISETNYKEEEVKRIVEKLSSTEQQIEKQEENHNSEINKYAKTIRKLEKILGQIRNEKRDLEKRNKSLERSAEKLQNEIDQIKQYKLISENQLSAKAAECTTLESELVTHRNKLHNLTQDYGKAQLEIEYLKKSQEQQKTEIKDTISNITYNESVYKEAQIILLNKEHEINDLKKIIDEKENKIKYLEQQYDFLKNQNEDQTKIMVGYENHFALLQDVEASKLKLEKDLNNLDLEHKTKITELELARREIDNLTVEMKALIARNEKERAFYKKQTHEIISEYSQQKENIEEEIDSISNQLRVVTESLHTEKHRFEELEKCHQELQTKYNQISEKLNAETAKNKNYQHEIENTKQMLKSLTNERDRLQKDLEQCIQELDEEKNNYVQVYTENKKMHMIIDQGKQQYSALLNKNAALDQQVNQLKFEMKTVINSTASSQSEVEKSAEKLVEKTAELKLAKDTIESLRKDLNESQKTLFELKEDYFKLQQHLTGLEFKNCELTLQLHEIHGKLETERSLFKELKQQQIPSAAPSERGELYYATDADL